MNINTPHERHLSAVYSFLASTLYLLSVVNILLVSNIFGYDFNRKDGLYSFFENYMPVFFAEHFQIYMILAFAFFGIFSQPQKKIDFSYKKYVIPYLIGTIVFGLLAYFLFHPLFLFAGLSANLFTSNISKQIKTPKGITDDDDRSFKQNEHVIEGLYSLPTTYNYHGKKRNGVINIDPFRGVFLSGIPGSGKTFSVINPYIKWALSNEFSCVIYDVKSPELTELAYYHFMMNKKIGKLKKHNFHIVDMSNVENSVRINPLSTKYITNLSDAMETAEVMVKAMAKSADSSGGSAQFFEQSAINFLGACIFYLSQKGEKYSTLPHLIALISQSYDTLFTMLQEEYLIKPMLSPYLSAWENGAYDQLEGQIGTVRINITKLASLESFWIFSGDELDFQICNAEKPAVIMMASSPSKVNVNGMYYSLLLMRITKVINTAGSYQEKFERIPTALIVDEAPTIYIHEVEQLIATARSNKVSVLLGVQDMSQLIKDYGNKIGKVIQSVMGTVITGAVRNKEMLDWLQTLFGKSSFQKVGVNVDDIRNSVNVNQQQDWIIPAHVIANLGEGEMVGSIASKYIEGQENINIFHGRIKLDIKKIINEEQYFEMPPVKHQFKDREKELLDNYKRIFADIEDYAKQHGLE